MTTTSPEAVTPVALHSRPSIATPETLILDETSPALMVLTDFARTSPRTVDADQPVDQAHQMMVTGGVRLLLVVDPQGRCSGVLPAREVIGGRRITLAMQQFGVAREEVTAGMVQTPLDKTPTLTMETLTALSIGDLVRSLKSFGEQHLLVTEPTATQGQRIRGVISAADIARVLGQGPVVLPEARSFADICRVVLGREL